LQAFITETPWTFPGSPSTFLKIRVSGAKAWVDIYRSDTNGIEYKLEKTVELN
jgi:hypothetical protein